MISLELFDVGFEAQVCGCQTLEALACPGLAVVSALYTDKRVRNRSLKRDVTVVDST
jgi:hypothetical protein